MLAGRRISAPAQIFEGRIIGRNLAHACAHFDAQIAQGQTLLNGHRRDRFAAILERKAVTRVGTKLSNQGKNDVLGRDTARHHSTTIDAQHLRTPLHQGLCCQHMRDLARTDTPGERTQCTDRAGMTIAADHGQARQRNRQFRRDHMDNALARITEIKQRDVMLSGVLAQGANIGRARCARYARRKRIVIATSRGRNHMVLGGKAQVRAAHVTASVMQLCECDVAGEFMQHVTVDVDQIITTAEGGHAVRVPNFIEQQSRSRRDYFAHFFSNSHTASKPINSCISATG